jgi:3',5'-cyclic AMP phosphodiesterase CpdA
MPIAKGSNKHVFGRTRPSKGGRHPIHRTPPRNTHFRDLPVPTGAAPYRLDLRTVLAEDDYAEIAKKNRLVFHLNGDMGGIKDAMPQELVAKGMEGDLQKPSDDGSLPQFLYLSGDCVYFNGEISQYYSQFYEPYELYPRPIFAVPGNHDGENLTGPPPNPVTNTLDGFIRNFCAPQPGIKREEAQGSFRTAMVQPNCFWTLLTPLCSIVGLYSNVPEGGEIKQPQIDWLVNELKTLPTNIPLFVALHHPLYSADDHHSGSGHMRQVLTTASSEADRTPDIILAGHVHNYQRLLSEPQQGSAVAHIVTGAGGYHNLHHIMKVDGDKMVPPVEFDAGDDETVTLERYSDDHHGFLRVEVTPNLIMGRYYEVPRPQEAYSKGNQLLDYWEWNWKQRVWVTNNL